jgi:hypothetical protein
VCPSLVSCRLQSELARLESSGDADAIARSASRLKGTHASSSLQARQPAAVWTSHNRTQQACLTPYSFEAVMLTLILELCIRAVPTVCAQQVEMSSHSSVRIYSCIHAYRRTLTHTRIPTHTHARLLMRAHPHTSLMRAHPLTRTHARTPTHANSCAPAHSHLRTHPFTSCARTDREPCW